MAGEAIETSHPAELNGSAVENSGVTGTEQATNFYDGWGLSEEQVGFIQHKGLKTPADIMKSYMEAQSFVGMDKNHLIKVPKADAEGNVDYSEVYKALGRPDDVSGYGIEGEVAEAFLPKLLELGITKTQAEGLAKSFDEYVNGTQESFNATAKKQYDEGVASLKKEWGKDYDLNVQLGNEAFMTLAKEMDLKEEDLPKMAGVIGVDKVAKLMLKLAGGKDEGVHNLTGYVAGQETKEVAAYKLAEMNRDPETAKKIMAHDHKTIDEINRLTKLSMGIK